MTALRPEHDAGQDGPYEQGAYEAAGAFEAAVDRLADPLNDPLPGRHASPWFRAGKPAEAAQTAEAPGAGRGQHRAPDGQARAVPRAQEQAQAPHGVQSSEGAPREWYDPEGFERDWYGQQAPAQAPAQAPVAEPRAQPVPLPFPLGDETVGLPRLRGDTPPGPESAPAPAPDPDPKRASDVESFAELGTEPEGTDPEPRTGGRAERRRAAKGRGRGRADQRPDTAATAAAQADKPMSRVEARRAARAAKDSPAVVASRVTGELFITLGVLMLLFVTYQLWWTNVRADQYAGKETHKIQDDWAKGDRNPGVFEAGQGFAIIHIPKLDVVAPIAEGISKEKVLDRGMVGHYGEGALRTAMPSAEQGNFALAGHRNTHGEPFRYINRLSPGDLIVVETQDAYYTYKTTRTLPQTSPSNVSVIDPVPRGSGFTGPGRYITLTTCTPEFTSTYRLIVWGKMVDERPRSKGKPDALVG
ncbi:class E sortase [Streptomyces sp. NBC_01363]|uniref:class E sortase n=1 Tax=Streptomyces sp. NBC_01363 TaxID=2903840 RepID=UPI00225BA47A|nr:class E sortase [Streptomyces sp. NBC_01363]MCX4730932.1 class E sortase [Streptomyces sp. NBC_01363]